MLTESPSHASIASMDSKKNQERIEASIDDISEHLTTIEQHLLKVVDENRRLRDVVRLAESELRKRRDRVQALEVALQACQDTDVEAENASEKSIEPFDPTHPQQSEEKHATPQS